MQFFQILALVGVASAHAVQTVTSVATATAPVVVADCTTVKPAVHTNSEWFNATQTVVVTLPPANTTAHHGANSTWGSGAKPTGTKPAPVTAGAAGTKASIAGLLGFAGVAMLVL